MLLRSTGVWSGNKSSNCGHMLPLKPLVSTVVKITGTPKVLAALANSSVLLNNVWRSMFATPNTICGW